MLAFHDEESSRPSWRAYLPFFISGVSLLLIGFGVWSWLHWDKETATLVEEVPAEQPLSEWVTSDPVIETGIDGGIEEGDQAFVELPPLPPPPAPDIERMKYEGCVADGFLSGYGDDINSSIALVKRSKCYSLHRALETWRAAPDFKRAREIQAEVGRSDIVYGMFIAEAIATNEHYYYPAEDREFDFKKMCRAGSKNDWGEHTCKPSFERKEYRKYLRYITERAMDMGIQNFLFGQIFYQERSDLGQAIIPDIIREMRDYASFRGMEIVIGAQTNDITDPTYLGYFDYIEGGVGLDADGTVENGPCFSRWWQKPGDWCWALLWHPDFKNKASNVMVHFDWSGKIGDDMSVFTRMTKEEREATLRALHRRFKNENVGFLLPLMATLHRENHGCYGPKKRYYSAHRKYTCQDEEVIDAILSGK